MRHIPSKSLFFIYEGQSKLKVLGGEAIVNPSYFCRLRSCFMRDESKGIFGLRAVTPTRTSTDAPLQVDSAAVNSHALDLVRRTLSLRAFRMRAIIFMGLRGRGQYWGHPAQQMSSCPNFAPAAHRLPIRFSGPEKQAGTKKPGFTGFFWILWDVLRSSIGGGGGN
jgi:hypothetical protein